MRSKKVNRINIELIYATPGIYLGSYRDSESSGRGRTGNRDSEKTGVGGRDDREHTLPLWVDFPRRVRFSMEL